MTSTQNSHFGLPQAVLWDLDGTLVDSEEYWIQAERELVEQFGGVWTHEDGLKVVGQGLSHTASALQEKGVTLSNVDIVAALVDRVHSLLESGQPWRPGALELIADLHLNGVRQAMVTMSYEKLALKASSLVPGQPFTVVVAGDHVQHAKPDPEAYLLASELLGVDTSECLAFEDSPAGITAASSAGVVTIGVENIIDLSLAPCFWITNSLAGVTASFIAEVFATAQQLRKSGKPLVSVGGALHRDYFATERSAAL